MILMSLIVRVILAIVGGWLIWLLLGPLARIIAQLTQSISQLALKPGDEEIKKKGCESSGDDVKTTKERIGNGGVK